jgi:hypothetical protein
MIALRGLGGGVRRRFVLLQLDGFQVKVEIVDVVTFSPINKMGGDHCFSFWFWSSITYLE